MNTNNGFTGGPPIPGGGRRRFRRGDVVVGDWVWGADASQVRPVIQVNRHTVTVGIQRKPGGWLTESLRWDELRGVIPAVADVPADLAHALDLAVRRVRGGFLDLEQRAALVTLLRVAGAATLPTPLTAVLFSTITALSRPSRDQSTAENLPDHPDPDDGDPGPDDGEEDRS